MRESAENPPAVAVLPTSGQIGSVTHFLPKYCQTPKMGSRQVGQQTQKQFCGHFLRECSHPGHRFRTLDSGGKAQWNAFRDLRWASRSDACRRNCTKRLPQHDTKLSSLQRDVNTITPHPTEPVPIPRGPSVMNTKCPHGF